MPIPIQNPAGYVVPSAIAFADGDGTIVPVNAASPLPVTLGGDATTALTGTATTSQVAGPYQPALGRAVMLLLTGSWSGTVKVTRSVDGGATRQPLTVAGTAWGEFTGNVCEPVWDESEGTARLYLDITLVSGSVTYRMAQ